MLYIVTILGIVIALSCGYFLTLHADRKLGKE